MHKKRSSKRIILNKLTRCSSLAAININRVVTRIAESSSLFIHKKTVRAGDLFGDTITAFQKLVTSGCIWEVAVRIRAGVGYFYWITKSTKKWERLIKEKKFHTPWDVGNIPCTQPRNTSVIINWNAAIFREWVRRGVVHLRAFHWLMQSSVHELQVNAKFLEGF